MGLAVLLFIRTSRPDPHSFPCFPASSHKCGWAFAAPSTSSRQCNLMTVVLTTSYPFGTMTQKMNSQPKTASCLRHKKYVHTQVVSIAVHHQCFSLLFRVVRRSRYGHWGLTSPVDVASRSLNLVGLGSSSSHVLEAHGWM